MLDEIKKNYSLIRILIILLIIAVGSYVLKLAWQIVGQFLSLLIIFLIAWLVSFILEPLVEFIRRFFHLSRNLSTMITYALMSLLLIMIGFVYIPLISSQVLVLSNLIPRYLNTILPLNVDWNTLVASQLSNAAMLVPSAAQFLFSAFIVLILSFYFIVDEEQITREFYHLMPKNWHNFLQFTEELINDTFVSFLRVQLFYGVSTGFLTWFVLSIFRIEFALSVAFLAGVFAVIPLIGSLLAIALPVLIALLINPIGAIMIGVFLLIIQQIIFNVIGPKLLGKAYQLHPAIILISFLVGLKFAGGLGAIFAIPVLGISAVMVRRFGHYFLEEVKGEAAKNN